MASAVREDFDRIALLPDEGWNESSHYHPFLLRQLPPRLDAALEIGCGTGAFARLLAARSQHVLALDLSPQMIAVARQRSQAWGNIEFRLADAMEVELQSDSFDCIASIATFHHLPMDTMLARVLAALRPGGTLILLDLYCSSALSDLLISAIAVPVAGTLRLWKTGRLRQSATARAAWDQHGLHDSYLKLRDIRSTCAATLPGAIVRRHLLWRYSVVWRKP
jgi:SAM-dependent methyltransferase